MRILRKTTVVFIILLFYQLILDTSLCLVNYFKI